jgi:RNA polymerase sigma-70 factor, ECF subfamily
VILDEPRRIFQRVSAERVVAQRLFEWSGAASEADWDALYEAQLPKVYNFFRYRVGCTADAEDLTALTFEKAWRARSRYRRRLSGFPTWLLAIARNVAIDHLRRQHTAVPLEEAATVPAPDRTPEQHAGLESDVERLSALLARLSPRQRDLVALKYGAELSNRAIAQLTGLTESNVGTILHRTVQDLRAAWPVRHEAQDG